MSHVPSVVLNSGHSIPQLGFGVWQLAPGDTERVVSAALEVGYRHIDTAAIYGNEREVGRAIAASGIAREELFVTTKLWNEDHQRAMEAVDVSLDKLGLDYLDLYLIHWPCPAQGHFVEAWRSLIAIQQARKARSVGVSNFRPEDITAIIDATGVTPAVNQIEIHPTFQQPQMRQFNASLGIVTEAWSPLGVGADLDAAPVVAVAKRHGVTPAQAVIRWHLQLGNVVFPKTATLARIAENFDVFGFQLTDADMAELAGADTGKRQGWDPANV